MFRLVVFGHEYRTGRGLRVVEWIGLHPGSKSRPVLVAKAAFEKLNLLLFPVQLGGKPAIEGVTIVDSLLSGQSGEPLSSNSEPTCLRILLCALSCPLCCLVPAPRGGDGDQGEYHPFDNFNRLKTGLRSMFGLVH